MKMTFKQYLTELFQEKKNFEIDAHEEDLFVAEFEVNGNSYQFSTSAEETDEEGEKWEIGLQDLSQDWEHDMEITGMAKEHAVEVYSYVISIFKYFIMEYKPQLVMIEPFVSRQFKLYNKLVKRFEKEINNLGYEISREGRYFLLHKKDEK